LVAASVSNNNASSFDNKPSSIFQLVVASVNWISNAGSIKTSFAFQSVALAMRCDWISKAKPDKTSQASLLVALAECRKANKFLTISTSDKTVNNVASVVDDEDKMVAPMLISEGAQV
jgi:hypothetical protein